MIAIGEITQRLNALQNYLQTNSASENIPWQIAPSETSLWSGETMGIISLNLRPIAIQNSAVVIFNVSIKLRVAKNNATAPSGWQYNYLEWLLRLLLQLSRNGIGEHYYWRGTEWESPIIQELTEAQDDLTRASLIFRGSWQSLTPFFECQ